MFDTHKIGVKLGMEETLEQSPKDHSKTSFIFIKIITFIECQLCVKSRDYKKL